ncbi:MAG TPA: 3-phosphoserine/phosphohydroxythreonine transaminase [Pyrinomonadaceae bacterium]|nr:3-phosphoserine/phosphohydroxythreonine transaminase [Pyrinomonadaceae bacterium]
MSERIYNFSAGPAVLPLTVLQRAQEEMLALPGVGMSVMEISHRSKTFERIIESARTGVRELLDLPENYHVLFLQGGASLQFSMIPMNLLGSNQSADYIVTGHWGEKAVKEAKKFGRTNTIFTSAADNFKLIPSQEELTFNSDAAYVHYTSNETIEGVEFKYEPDGKGVPVVCDASSNIMSKPIDARKYALIYAGAQKNLGPSGVTLVIIRDDLLQRAPENLPSLLNYRVYAENNSLANTPNTWGIYLLDLVCQWIKEEGGLAEMQRKNEGKARILYDALDSSEDFYRPHADQTARSLMNVTFRLPSEELEAMFVSEAEKNGLNGLKGHRSVGGIRASIYNAFPREGVEKLVSFMKDFAQKNA